MHCLPADHQSDLDRLPSFYWWHRHRINTVVGAVRRLVPMSPDKGFTYMDVGGGTGATTYEIVKALRTTLSLDIPDGATVCVEGDVGLGELQSKKPITYHHADLEGNWSIPSGPFKLVTLLDVLEHLQNPVSLLKRISKHLDRSGIAVITVPAYSFLFSQWDVTLGHKKRYTRSLLRRECETAGLRVVWDSYLFSYLLPPVVIKRLLVKESPGTSEFPAVPPWLNSILKGLGTAEHLLAKVFPIPFGTSVTAIVRRP